MITCFIRYEIDPFKVPQFEQYARTWGQAIPGDSGRDAVVVAILPRKANGTRSTGSGGAEAGRISPREGCDGDVPVGGSIAGG